MAEETPMSPVSAAEPPKANPLSKPGATVTGLKPGLRLPPKPGATAVLKPGLKLPPKPGATATLKPGLKLPPKPGATATLKPGATATLKPGLKLPPKPVIRKPGSTVAAKPLPKPVIGAPAAAAPAATPTPVAPTPAATPAPAPNPTVVPVDAQGVGKLPTVEAKAIARDDVKPLVTENPKPMEALKSVTQKLKGITQQIPQQAILRKTGIIAEEAMTDAQKQAAKSKTARISLSDAMGVAPVKDENAPMKTIKIKRPVNVPGATGTKLSPISPKPEAAATSAAGEKAPESAPDATITQRKTLKISRPGGGAVRPTGKFGIKRPASQAATVAKPAADAATEAPQDGAVADIPDIPNIPEMPVAAAPAQSEGPAWLWTISALVQAAACVAIGALAWFLYQNTQTNYF